MEEVQSPKSKVQSLEPNRNRLPNGAKRLECAAFPSFPTTRQHPALLPIHRERRNARTLRGSLASPAGRKKIAHRFIGGPGRGRGTSPVRDGRVLSSLAGLVLPLRSYPPMNLWAIFFRPAGLAQIPVRFKLNTPHSKRFAILDFGPSALGFACA